MGFYFRIALPGPFGYSVRLGGKKRRRRRTTTAARSRPAPAAKVATEAEKVRIRQAIRHAIERADQDAFELAYARFLDLARTKVGGGDLGSLGQIALLTDDEDRALKAHLQVISECLGHPERLADAQAAADQYNLIADKANRRVTMAIQLDTPGVSDENRLERIKVSSSR